MSVVTEKSQLSGLPENSGPKSHHWLADLSELVKARLSLLVLITTLVGFLFGWRGELNLLYLFHTLCGTALAAAGAAALNEVIEVDLDARMRRTRNRPLPGRRMTLEEGLIIGVTCSVAGILWLSFATNLCAGVLCALTIGIYVFVYTPLKQKTTLNTIVGAVPGALPPMIGWAAARGHVDFEAWILFAILFMWQMPHFLAISWIYRDEYKEAGFVMLSGSDPDCRVTGRQSLLYTMGLVSISLLPAMLELTNIWYVPIAAIMGVYFFLASLKFALTGTRESARALFLSSIIYLPVTLAALVFTRA
jgi:protoheme IX farnesyltransferase